MTAIKKLTDSSGVQYFPQTHTKAVVDDQGNSVEGVLGMQTQLINQAQLEVGVVPSDIYPTKGSTNWATSGGIWSELYDSTDVFINSSEVTWSAGNVNSQGALVTTYANMYTIVDIETNVEYRLRLNNSTSFTLSTYKYVNNKWNVISGLGSLTGEVTKTFTVTDSTRILFMFWDKPTAAQAQAIPLSVDVFSKKYMEKIPFDTEPTDESNNLVTSGGVYDAMYIDRLTTGNGITWIQGGINGQTGVYETNTHAICTEPIFIDGDANASVYPGYLGGYNAGIAVYDTAGTFRSWSSSVDISSLEYLVGYVRFVHYGNSSQYPTPSDGASTGAYVVKRKMIEERLAALEDYQIKTYSNPVCAVDFADPTVWDGEDGYYYALATGSVTGRTMKRSANLVDWEDTNDLPYTSDVADTILSNFGSYTIYWAPCVYKVNNNQWNMYLSKPYGGVAILTSSYPTMGYQFIRQTTAPFGDYIDADVARDRDGKLWMFAGSAYMMHRRQMTDNGLDFAENSSWEHVAGRPATESGNTNRIKTFEGEYLYRRGGYWYLFCSSGQYNNSTYAIRVVRSQTLDGTFVDKEGNLATEGYAETIMSSGSSLYGPGHNAQIIVDRDNKTWMLYHSHWSGASSSSHRGLCLDEVKWDENGWPYFEGGVPSITHVVPNM